MLTLGFSGVQHPIYVCLLSLHAFVRKHLQQSCSDTHLVAGLQEAGDHLPLWARLGHCGFLLNLFYQLFTLSLLNSLLETM